MHKKFKIVLYFNYWQTLYFEKRLLYVEYNFFEVIKIIPDVFEVDVVDKS